MINYTINKCLYNLTVCLPSNTVSKYRNTVYALAFFRWSAVGIGISGWNRYYRSVRVQ